MLVFFDFSEWLNNDCCSDEWYAFAENVRCIRKPVVIPNATDEIYVDDFISAADWNKLDDNLGVDIYCTVLKRIFASGRVTIVIRSPYTKKFMDSDMVVRKVK